MSMSNKAARNLFIFGSLFFFVIFIAMTVDTLGKLDSRAPQISQAVDDGKMVWHKYDCIGCHTIFGNGTYFAPDMTKVAARKPKSYLKKFLMDPKAVKGDAVMPTLGITSDEADKLIAFLDWVSKVDTNNWPPKPILATAAGVSGKELTAGQLVYQSQGCSNCHTINGIGGTSGPDLTKVGSKHDKDWFIGHFKEPQKFVKNSAMPPVTSSDAELEQLTAYMLTLKEVTK
jgi:nitric oxide reductase subunit C